MTQIGIVENDIKFAKLLSQFIDSQHNYHSSFYTSSIEDLKKVLRRHNNIDLLLLDIVLDGNVNSLEFLPDLIDKYKLKVLVISGYNEELYIAQLLSYGAAGLYIKGSGLTKLTEAINCVLEGNVFIPPEAGNHVAKILSKNNLNYNTFLNEDELKIKKIYDSLNQRETEVLKYLIQGMRYEDIGIKLYISINTVRHYVKIIYYKFEVGSKAALVAKVGQIIKLLNIQK